MIFMVSELWQCTFPIISSKKQLCIVHRSWTTAASDLSICTVDGNKDVTSWSQHVFVDIETLNELEYMLNNLNNYWIRFIKHPVLFQRLLCVFCASLPIWSWPRLAEQEAEARRLDAQKDEDAPQLLGKAQVPFPEIGKKYYQPAVEVYIYIIIYIWLYIYNYIKWWVLSFDAIRCRVSLSSFKTLKRLPKLVGCLASAAEYHNTCIFYLFQCCVFGSSTVQELLKSTSLGQKVAQRWEVRM